MKTEKNKTTKKSLARFITKMQSEQRDIYQYMVFPFDKKKSEKLENSEDEFLEENFSGISREDLAKRIGISKETLKKRLCKTRPINRDFVIAVCSQLQLGYRNTNYALSISDFPLLYSGDKYLSNERDKILIDALQDGSAKLLSLDQINERLIFHNLVPLDIKGRKSKEIKTKYIVLETEVKITDYDYAIFNPYDSLETLFDINQYHLMAHALIELNSSKKRLNLEIHDDKSAIIFNNEQKAPEFLTNYNDSLEFSDVFNDLNKMIKQKRKEIFLQLDDTRNYYKRSSAKYINGEIHVFSEKYNFNVPENNEYFFADYYDNSFHFYISKRSQFLHYQTGNEYKKIFSKYDPQITHEFNSIIEIKNYYKKNPISHNSTYLEDKIVNDFEDLTKIINLLLSELKQNRVFIRNPNVFDGPNSTYNMCKFLGLEKQFEFIIDNQSNNPFEKEYTNLKNDFKVEYFSNNYIISIEDVKQAFVYGLNNLDDICAIKSKYGSIKNWISSLSLSDHF